MTEVMTGSGPVNADDLGFVLPHEHVFMNLMKEYRGDGLLQEYDLALDELTAFALAGGGTIVDCTSGGLSPDPELVARVCAEAGVNVVLGCGYYRDPYLDPAWLDPYTVSEVADRLIRTINEGFGTSGVRPGIIGEIGADNRYISALEERSFRAAARAHKATGLTITTHSARWPVGLLQLDLLQEEGVEPERVIIGHCDTVPSMDYHLEVARRGAYVEFDTIHGKSTYDLDLRVRYVENLLEHGYGDQILLSHDVCLRSHLLATGGGGYTLITEDFIPRMRRAGIDDAAITKMTHVNPVRALTGG